METVWRDLVYGLRRLSRKPGLTAVAILSLAIGIGASSAIFSVASALLLRPLPFQNADRLAILWSRSPGLNVAQDWLSLGQYLDIKMENHVFDEVAVTIGGSFNMTGQGLPEHIEAARVSSSLFPLLGAEASLGRVFAAEDDQKGPAPSVILSHGFWQRRFGSDSEVLGKTLTLNEQSYTIIGVAPPRFALTKEVLPTVDGIQKADVFLPLPVSDADRAKRGGEDYNILARLKPGITAAQAQADVDSITAEMMRQYPANYPPGSGFQISVVPLLEQVVGDVRLALYILAGAVAFVVMIACANVANLLLSRGAARQKEMGIRAAVGASRIRLMRQLLTESVLLAAMGGLVGLTLALVGVKVLRAFGAAGIPRLEEVTIDGRVLAFTLVVTIATGIVFGLVPALRASRVDLNDVLKDGGRGSSGGAHQRLRSLLVIAEVAMSLVLLIGAGLLIRSYSRIAGASPGFNPRHVVSMRLALPAARYANQNAVMGFYQQLEERVRRLPGIESVSTSYLLPLTGNSLGWEPTLIDGYVPKNPNDVIISNVDFVGPEYFQTMGIPLLRGRRFDDQDKKGSREVAIVDVNLAERFWPNEDPLGKRVQRGPGGPWRTVVGVVKYEKQYGQESEPPIRVYYPINQFPVGIRYLVARAAGDPAQATAAAAAEIRALDSELPVFDVQTMDQRLGDSLARRRFAMFLLGLFAAIALTLAAAGIYGVMSYWVNQRTGEIGIRMALGAPQGNILRLVLRQASVLVLTGTGIGLAAAFALTRLMSGLLFGIGATDRLTYVAISLLLGGVALLASFIPARRAARLDPMIAIRYE